MTHDPDDTEFACLLERLGNAQRNLHQTYDRLDVLAAEVEGLTDAIRAFTGPVAMRSDLLLALTKAEHAARAAASEMRKAEAAISVATTSR